MTTRIPSERTDWFITVSGRRLFINDPDPEQLDIKDIAHALSNLCRFGGMARTFYSVAQHSVMVSRLVPPELALTGLLHDATEAYLGDVIRPLKRQLPDYGEIEGRWTLAICERFGLVLHRAPYVFDWPEEVKRADGRALLTERKHLLSESHLAVEQWPWVEDELGFESAPWSVPLSPVEARQQFLARFKELTL